MRSNLMSALLAGVGALVLLAPAVQAQDSVVIYRCTDANGALTVQNDVPCPKGSKQERRVIQSVPAPSPPAPIPPPAVPVPAPPAVTTPPPPLPVPAATAEPAIADADRLPPPVLFECRTHDNDRYLSDDGNPPPRCYRMTTTGLGGLNVGGAGEACEMKNDQCQRVADGALCDGWQERLRMAESALRFGTGDRETAQAEVERIGRIVRESTCGM